MAVWELQTEQYKGQFIMYSLFLGKATLPLQCGYHCHPEGTSLDCQGKRNFLTDLLPSFLKKKKKSVQLIMFFDNSIHVYNMLWLLSPQAFFLIILPPLSTPSSIPVLFPNWWVWFCSVTHSVTKIISRTVRLELFTGAQRGQQWVHHWRQWLPISLSFSEANMSAARVGHLELLLTNDWL